MPPSYAPLQVDPNFIAQAYAQPTTTFNDVLKQQAALRAQELATQNQAIQTQQNQIKFDQQNAIRQGVKDQFANTTDFDPKQGLDLALKIALKEGDTGTAMDLQRAIQYGSGFSLNNEPLSPELLKQQSDILGVQLPEGTTNRDIAAIANSKRAQGYGDQVNLNKGYQPLKVELASQQATGTKIVKPSETMATQMGEHDAFLAKSTDILNNYLPDLPEDRATRFLSLATTNSAASRMKQELGFLAKGLAAAVEGGRLSNQDYEIVLPLVQIQDLDTIETVVNKVQRLHETLGIQKKALLEGWERGGFNVSAYKDGQTDNENLKRALAVADEARRGQGIAPANPMAPDATYGVNPPGVAPSNTLTPEEQAYKEQYKARLRQGGG